MKVLVLADHESKSLYEHYDPEKLKDVDLIIACGDLRQKYLEFFATLSHAPVLYVAGNHDYWYNPRSGCGGCTCIEDRIFEYKGVRILGLGGCMRYHPDVDNQYTEQEMTWRIRKLWWQLKRKGGIDILVTHAPARGVNDLEDLPHQGFECFRGLLEKYEPALFIHGHVHANYGGFKRVDQFGKTVVINAYDHYMFEYPDVVTKVEQTPSGNQDM
ncbi:MAG: metallophosphoesterase [Eubacteriales bacterium]|nr:metallophosphoesterase [Eubacteriales bacterium]